MYKAFIHWTKLKVHHFEDKKQEQGQFWTHPPHTLPPLHKNQKIFSWTAQWFFVLFFSVVRIISSRLTGFHNKNAHSEENERERRKNVFSKKCQKICQCTSCHSCVAYIAKTVIIVVERWTFCDTWTLCKMAFLNSAIFLKSKVVWYIDTV